MTSLTWTTKKMNIDELKPFEKNPRKITAEAMDKLKDRITKRGFHDVLKLDTANVVLSGNQRTQALRELGAKEVNVLVPSRKLTEEERKAIVLESNRSDGEWDNELLVDFGSEVLLEVGFETKEIDMLLEEDEDEEDAYDTEKTVKAIKKPKAKVGDIYQLGEHRVMCGDCTSGEHLEKLMDGKLADMIWTDPSYNVNYENEKHGGILNDKMSDENFFTFTQGFVHSMKEWSRGGAPFYVCSGFGSFPTFIHALHNEGMKYATPIVWVKPSAGLGMNDYRHQSELIIKVKNEKKGKRSKKGEVILYGWNEGKHYFLDTRSESDVWEVSRRGASTMSHPTQKPIALINRAVKNSSKRGDLILDLFGGSFSTLVSAHKTGRVCYSIELDPKYVDAGIERWEKLTGNTAIKI